MDAAMKRAAAALAMNTWVVTGSSAAPGGGVKVTSDAPIGRPAQRMVAVVPVPSAASSRHEGGVMVIASASMGCATCTRMVASPAASGPALHGSTGACTLATDSHAGALGLAALSAGSGGVPGRGVGDTSGMPGTGDGVGATGRPATLPAHAASPSSSSGTSVTTWQPAGGGAGHAAGREKGQTWAHVPCVTRHCCPAVRTQHARARDARHGPLPRQAPGSI